MKNKFLHSAKLKPNFFLPDWPGKPRKIGSLDASVEDWLLGHGKSEIWQRDAAFSSSYLESKWSLWGKDFFVPSGFQNLWAEAAVRFLAFLWAETAVAASQKAVYTEVTASNLEEQVKMINASTESLKKKLSAIPFDPEELSVLSADLAVNPSLLTASGSGPLKNPETIKKLNYIAMKVAGAKAAVSVTVADVVEAFDVHSNAKGPLTQELIKLYKTSSSQAPILMIGMDAVLDEFDDYSVINMSKNYIDLFGGVTEDAQGRKWPLYVFPNRRPEEFGFSSKRANVIYVWDDGHGGFKSTPQGTRTLSDDGVTFTYVFRSATSIEVPMVGDAAMVSGPKSARTVEPLELSNSSSEEPDTEDSASDEENPALERPSETSSSEGTDDASLGEEVARADSERARGEMTDPPDFVERQRRARQYIENTDPSVGQEDKEAEAKYEEEKKWGKAVAVAGLSAASLLLLLWLLGVPQTVCAELCRKGILPKITGRIAQCGSLVHWKSPHPIYDDEGKNSLSSRLLYETLALSRRVTVQGGGDYTVEDYDARKVFHLQLSGIKGHFYVRSHILVGDKILYRAYNPFYHMGIVFWPWPVDHKKEYESFF